MDIFITICYLVQIKYGYNMDSFINKINFDFHINQLILKLISFIDSFKGKWNIVESKENIFYRCLNKFLLSKRLLNLF